MFNPLKEMANDAKSLKTLSSNAKEALLGMSPLEADEEDVSVEAVMSESLDLHRAAYYDDTAALSKLLPTLTPSQRGSLIPRTGHSALHVAVLRKNYKALQLLLDADIPTETRSTQKWTALDEAVALKDFQATKMLLTKLRWETKQERKQRKPKLLVAMNELPPFSIQMRWELGSPFFGYILRQFTPDDTYTIYKSGTQLRVDGTLRGLDTTSTSLFPHWKRGPFSLVVDAGLTPVTAYLLDHVDKTYIDLYAERKEAVVDIDADVADLLQLGAGRVRLKGSEINMDLVKGFLGRPKTAVVDGTWKTYVYECAGELVAAVVEKIPVVISNEASFETYLDMKMPEDKCSEVPWDPLTAPPSALTASAAAATATASSSPSGSSGGDAEQGEGAAVVPLPQKGRVVKARFWLSDNFPMTLKQLLPFLEAIGAANKHIAAAASFMRSYREMDMFPVKMQVPLMWTVYLLIRFRHYRELKPGDSASDPAFYARPSDYTRIYLKDVVPLEEEEEEEEDKDDGSLKFSEQ